MDMFAVFWSSMLQAPFGHKYDMFCDMSFCNRWKEIDLLFVFFFCDLLSHDYLLTFEGKGMPFRSTQIFMYVAQKLGMCFE